MLGCKGLKPFHSLDLDNVELFHTVRHSLPIVLDLRMK